MKEPELGEKAGEISHLGVSWVALDRFRNYASQTVTLSPGFNVLFGANAQGKTNFLEALYLLSTTRLLRGQRDFEAIQEGAERATLSLELADTGTQLGIVLERGVRKRATLNGLGLPRAADLIGRLPCVCVSAEDMAIVRGDPAERRLFLDLELSALSPAYLRHLTYYKRALEQRNALLREHRENPVSSIHFGTWEEQMAEHGAALRQRRQTYVDRLSDRAQAIHHELGQGEPLRLAYLVKDSGIEADALREALIGSRQTDSLRGGTAVGPHRDDMLFEVDGREARLYGSQGQQRTTVISLKFGCLEIAREEFGRAPLLLLDDILSDLDASRRQRLVDVVLDRAAQAVLTCTEADAAGERILSQARLFEVRNGQVTLT